MESVRTPVSIQQRRMLFSKPNKECKMKKVIVIAGLCLSVLVFALSSANAGWVWTTVELDEVSISTSDYWIKVSGGGAYSFDETEIHVHPDLADEYANRLLALLLSAAAVGKTSIDIRFWDNAGTANRWTLTGAAFDNP
jgi:hypothetical protein